MKKLLISLPLLCAISLSPLVQASSSLFLKKGKIAEQLKNDFLNTSIDFDLDVLKVDSIKGLGLTARYGYDVAPSFKQGYHTRIDRWVIKADIKPGDLIKEVSSSPFSFGLEKQKQITFLRQFKRKAQALSATPYGLKKLPMNADKALKELKEGDFVSFPATMTLHLGTTFGQLNPFAMLNLRRGADFGLFMSGRYDVQILRMKGKKVRIKIVTKATRGFGLNTSARVSARLFGIEYLDRQLESLHPLLMATPSFKKEKGKLFILDYIFDLGHSKARAAYDQILSSTFKLKDGQALATQFKKNSNIENTLVGSFDLADELAQQDQEKSHNVRVQRMFKGLNIFKHRGMSINLAAVVAKVNGNTGFTQNNITYTDRTGQKHNYFYPVRTNRWERKSGLTYRTLKERGEFSLFGLVASSDTHKNNQSADLGFRYYRQDTKLNQYEQKRILKKLSLMLPLQLYQDIKWEVLQKELNTTLSVSYVLKKNIFHQLAPYSKDDLNKLFYRYLKRMLKYKFISAETAKKPRDENKQEMREEIINNLYTILNEQMSAQDILAKLMSMSRNAEYQRYGIGFILSLVPDQSLENLEKLIYFKIDYRGDTADERNYTFSNHDNKELYDQLYAIQSALNNDSYDINFSGQVNF